MQNNYLSVVSTLLICTFVSVFPQSAAASPETDVVKKCGNVYQNTPCTKNGAKVPAISKYNSELSWKPAAQPMARISEEKVTIIPESVAPAATPTPEPRVVISIPGNIDQTRCKILGLTGDPAFKGKSVYDPRCPFQAKPVPAK